LKPDTELNKINILFVTVQPLASCYEHQAVHNRFAVSKPRTVAWCISTTTLFKPCIIASRCQSHVPWLDASQLLRFPTDFAAQCKVLSELLLLFLKKRAGPHTKEPTPIFI